MLANKSGLLTKSYLPWAIFLIVFWTFLLVVMSFCAASSLQLVQSFSSDGNTNSFRVLYTLDLGSIHTSKNIPEIKGSQRFFIDHLDIYTITGDKLFSFKPDTTTTANDLINPVQAIPFLKMQLHKQQLNQIPVTNIGSIISISFLLSVTLTILLALVIWTISSGILFKQFSCCDYFGSIRLNRKFDWLNALIPNNPLLYCVTIFLLSRLIFAFEYFLISNHGGTNLDFFTSMCHWDCGWYSDLIQHGYQLHPIPVFAGEWRMQANWAFFPLFPMLTKLLSLSGLPLVAGVYLNQLFVFASLWLIYDYLVRNFSISTARYSTLLLSLSLENIYFFTLYTEATFIFLSILCINLISRQRLLLATVICGFLSATRFVGFLMFFVILYSYSKTWFIQNQRLFSLSFIIRITGIFVVSTSGLWLYMLYLQLHIHDFLGFYHIQAAWGRNSNSWLLNPFASLSSLLNSGYPLDRFLFYLSIFMLFYFIRSNRYNEFIFLGLCCLVSVASKSLVSFSRFMFAYYPFYIFWGEWTLNRRFLKLAILVIFLFLHLVWLLLWLTNANYPA